MNLLNKNTDTFAKKSVRRARRTKGQTLVEYSLVLTFISILALSVLTPLGLQIKGLYLRIDAALVSAMAGR